jgi:membrane fusion protein (multidrug efflux system)
MAEETDVAGRPAPGLPEPVSYFAAHPRVKYLLAGLLVIIAIAGFFVWDYYSTRESTDDAQIDGHIHPISARVGGTVIRIAVRDNQYVTAGTLLVELDPRDYQVALDQARADLAAAQASREASRVQVPITSTATTSQSSDAHASLAGAEAGVAAARREQDAAEARASSARARVRAAQANSSKAARDVERLRPLLAKEEISQQQFDAAVAVATALEAEVDAAKAQVAEAEEGIRVAATRVEQAQARARQAQAAVEAASSAAERVQAARAQSQSAAARTQQAAAAVAQSELNLQYTRVFAPVSGVISRRAVEVGEIVQPGQPLLALVDLEDVWVTANFKETQLHHIQPGQKAIISVDAYGGKEFTGRVDSIAGATGAEFSLLPAENATGNYVKVVQRVPVKIVFDKGQNPNHLLRPGMSVMPTVLVK